jgi:hypothetical protein
MELPGIRMLQYLPQTPGEISKILLLKRSQASIALEIERSKQ